MFKIIERKKKEEFVQGKQNEIDILSLSNGDIRENMN